MALTHSMACRKIGDIEKGSYSANANIPEVVHGSLVKGKFEDTLETSLTIPLCQKPAW